MCRSIYQKTLLIIDYFDTLSTLNQAKSTISTTTIYYILTKTNPKNIWHLPNIISIDLPYLQKCYLKQILTFMTNSGLDGSSLMIKTASPEPIVWYCFCRDRANGMFLLRAAKFMLFRCLNAATRNIRGNGLLSDMINACGLLVWKLSRKNEIR